ncbi:hypothetical protein LSCM1_03203 [Leishmania martiniquensis]|uniref:non-specific serine/threonine protein kinase n=1 Tax=Leishmania martiniquensis TaxID=1580590 RepID=A0A836GG42_9TRYP|nr:hypothetical protein LSCM1_03203 [Leishmania martiniquensis]
MGNQLAATAAVDLANVSSDLELVAPLGAEGRNYFATFHCLKYTTVTSPTGNGGRSRGSRLAGVASYSCDSNAPQCFYGFVSAEVGGSRGGSGALHQRLEYRPNSLFRASSTALLGGVSADFSSPTVVGVPAGAAGRGRGRGRGIGRAGGGTSALYALSDSVAASTEAMSTTQLLARERAAWHQARWRQRLPVADRPWRTIPSSLGPEAESWRGAAMDAVMDRWCRDTRAGATAAASGGHQSLRASTAESSSPYGASWPHASAVHQTMPTSAAPSSYSTAVPGKSGNSQNIDALVAGVSGEWRSNYGNYVQLLLRSGAGAGLMLSSAVAAYGDLCITVPSAPTSAGSMPSASLQQRYVVESVVTKVFVRTLDDPGQAYFLKYVHQIMDSAGEQLRSVDSRLHRLTPRNCLWYSLICEGDGFCVLQRPYIAFTLRERLAARPVWTAHEKLFIVYQLLEAVSQLHETYALIHGDIKPNNVLVQSTGVVVLCDMALFKPCRMPLDSPLLFDYYYDTDENRACYVAPEKFSDQSLPKPPVESKARGSATYNVSNVNADGHTTSMDIFSTACVVLFLYKEEDPLTLSQVLRMRHFTSNDAREAAVVPVLRDSNVPDALHSLLLPMLCAAAGERPSARELVDRGLQQRIFPASFPYLYKSVLPRLLTTAPEMRLVLLHNQLEVVLQRCETLDKMQADGGSRSSASESEAVATTEAVGVRPAALAVAASSSRELAVSLLLPLLLQTLHSIRTSDEAVYRGLLCLRQCASYCSFTCLVDAILPHVLFYVNNDAHVYGPPTRLIALRLLSFISEVIARHLTLGSSQRCSGSSAISRDLAAAKAGEEAVEASTVPEEQWALMEHLVLPCLYDVLRQAEQESTAVLVEVARQLPRLLLLARYITERRQLLYGADASEATPSKLGSRSGPQGQRARPPREAALEQQRCHDTQHAQPRRHVHQQFSCKGSEEGDGVKTVAAEATRSPTPVSPPLPPQNSSDGLYASTAEVASLSEHSSRGGTRERPAPAARPTEFGDLTDSMSDAEGGNVDDVCGASAAGTQQYLTQLHCLLTNGWSMLQVLYNHPCVSVVAEVMQQSASTVAAFLGEERVTEDLIPLLTTALAAPLRVQRLLYSQAILIHALLQRPPTKTLHLFVEEGLRHKDDVCINRTLHGLSVIVRSRRLPLEETMALVHQSLPLLMENRLWLREAACSVVEAAAQTYSTCDIALHLEYAVRPLLMLPVPLAHLRRYAATAIRAELATPFMSMDGAAGQTLPSCIRSTLWRERASNTGSAFLLDEDIFEDDAPVHQSPASGDGGVDGRHGRLGQLRGLEDGLSKDFTFKDVLPAVVAVTRAYASGPAPALLHALPFTEASPLSMAESEARLEASISEVGATLQHTCSITDAWAVVEDGGGSDGTALVYRPTSRELARVQREDDCVLLPLEVSSALLSSLPSSLVSFAADTSTAARPVSHYQPPTPPHSMDASPLPATLPPPSGVSRCVLRDGDGRVLRSRVSQHSLSSTAAAASTAARSSFAPSLALRPTAAALSSISVHTGAIYAAAPSPLGNGLVVSAGARGEAFVWRVSSPSTSTAHTRELRLVERVAAAASNVREHTYTACQWITAPGQRRDVAPSSAVASASGGCVAFSSTDGALRVLDVEKNEWVSSVHVGGSLEGGLTGLALQDEASLLAITAGGGLHVVDTRCRAVHRASVEDSAAASTASVWRTQLNPLDGAPSCVCPLYTGDKACAAAVGTCGGAVCLYDLRYQLCAQRVVLARGEAGQSSSSTPAPSMRLSITAACVDPLSLLCESCRPPTLEPAPAVGPSLLLGTTQGTVYRLLLQQAAYWPVFQCCRNDSSAVRTMLTQPSHGLVFTGSEDGYIRSWSTDHPQTSHTLACAPYRSPEYTLVRTCAAERVLEANMVRGDALPTSGRNISKILASLTVHEGSGTYDGDFAVPRHAPDAILTLCAVYTTTNSALWSFGNSGGRGGGEACYLLSGSRDGTLTLWDNDFARS